MKKILPAMILAVLLTACLHEDKGLHTGQTLKACASITPDQREEAARSIKGMSRDDAVKVLAAKYNVSAEAAKACLK